MGLLGLQRGSSWQESDKKIAPSAPSASPKLWFMFRRKPFCLQDSRAGFIRGLCLVCTNKCQPMAIHLKAGLSCLYPTPSPDLALHLDLGTVILSLSKHGTRCGFLRILKMPTYTLRTVISYIEPDIR